MGGAALEASVSLAIARRRSRAPAGQPPWRRRYYFSPPTAW